ncbi:hypothetical protein Glove_363g3 [Diversispora epigaea]|uniref:Uncharacterized protein n=1 Tax=Diversispora epigaea TaxID=1348612 RepID=A0A397HD40_9GLOM|nr:hypothetical protein Glove_363g3 [Diversispora epigaea]
MKNSNDTLASNIFDNTSNSDVAPKRIENSFNITSDSYIFQKKNSQPFTFFISIENGNTSEEKAINKFLDLKHRETTGGPEKSNINEASQHLVQLCDKAFDVEDGTNRANQEEILCWSIYRKNFKIQFNEIIKNSRGKIGEKKARSLLYNSIIKQLFIIRKKKSQELNLYLSEISRNALRKKTQRAEKIYMNVNTNNAGHQILSENTEILESGNSGKISSEIYLHTKLFWSSEITILKKKVEINRFCINFKKMKYFKNPKSILGTCIIISRHTRFISGTDSIVSFVVGKKEERAIRTETNN